MGAIPAFVKKQVEEQNSEAAKAETGETVTDPQESKHKRDYEILDANALYAFNPNLFKLVPNYKKITQALKLGFTLPGVAPHRDGEFVNHHEGDENAA